MDALERELDLESYGRTAIDTADGVLKHGHGVSAPGITEGAHAFERTKHAVDGAFEATEARTGAIAREVNYILNGEGGGSSWDPRQVPVFEDPRLNFTPLSELHDFRWSKKLWASSAKVTALRFALLSGGYLVAGWWMFGDGQLTLVDIIYLEVATVFSASAIPCSRTRTPACPSSSFNPTG